jgi:hypothetical protein
VMGIQKKGWRLQCLSNDILCILSECFQTLL